MRLRATLAGVLAVILLSLSSAASACQLRCDLARVSAPCHGGEAHSPLPRQRHAMLSAMQGRAMQGMTMAGAPQAHASARGAFERELVLAVPNACRHPVCSEQPMLLSKESAPPAPVALSYDVVFVVAALLRLQVSSVPVSARGAPWLPTPTPVSLHTTLRV